LASASRGGCAVPLLGPRFGECEGARRRAHRLDADSGRALGAHRFRPFFSGVPARSRPRHRRGWRLPLTILRSLLSQRSPVRHPTSTKIERRSAIRRMRGAWRLEAGDRRDARIPAGGWARVGCARRGSGARAAPKRARPATRSSAGLLRERSAFAGERSSRF
jgi:hypothetical protein